MKTRADMLQAYEPAAAARSHTSQPISGDLQTRTVFEQLIAADQLPFKVLIDRSAGLFMFPPDKGRFYHDGRFKTLPDVVNSYDQGFSLGLTDQEKHDLVEYVESL
jgi:hypothetical protein